MTMQTYFNFSEGTHVTIVQEDKCFQNEFFIHDNVPSYSVKKTNVPLNKMGFNDTHLKWLACSPDHYQTENM